MSSIDSHLILKTGSLLEYGAHSMVAGQQVPRICLTTHSTGVTGMGCFYKVTGNGNLSPQCSNQALYPPGSPQPRDILILKLNQIINLFQVKLLFQSLSTGCHLSPHIHIPEPKCKCELQTNGVQTVCYIVTFNVTFIVPSAHSTPVHIWLPGSVWGTRDIAIVIK